MERARLEEVVAAADAVANELHTKLNEGLELAKELDGLFEELEEGTGETTRGFALYRTAFDMLETAKSRASRGCVICTRRAAKEDLQVMDGGGK